MTIGKRETLTAVLVLLACIAGTAPARAQQGYGRAFVSGTGTDSGTCNRPAPCKTFAYAISQTPAGGQIAVIDTADFGPVTITKSLTIAAEDGAIAIIHGDGTSDGVAVKAGTSDVVNLRGLAMENDPTGLYIQSGNVNLEHSTITGGTYGIYVDGTGRLTVSDTTIAGSTDYGIQNNNPASMSLIASASLPGAARLCS